MRLLFILFLLSFLSSCNNDYSYQSDLVQNEIKMCFLGDTGMGSTVQREVAEKLREEKCHSIHFLGDLVYPNGVKSSEDSEIRKKFLRYYRKLTEENFGPKLYLLMGNHDYRGSISAWQELATDHHYLIFPHPYYLIRHQGICLVHIDTNFYKLFSEFLQGAIQAAWLTDLTKNLKDCSLKIALTHHPYASRGKHHGNSSGLLKLFLSSVVLGEFDYLISGHDHILSDEGIHEGTRQIISGGGSAPDEGEPPGYFVLVAEKKEGRYQIKSSYFKKIENNLK